MRNNKSEIFRFLLNHTGSTINEVIDGFGKPHKCPKCNGSGTEIVKVDTVETTVFREPPMRIPNWGMDQQTERDCSVCDGFGYTEIKMIAKPIMYEYVESK